MKGLRACKKCNRLTTETICPYCGGETTHLWKGLAVIVDHKRSEVARVMGVEEDGEYALKVR